MNIILIIIMNALVIYITLVCCTIVANIVQLKKQPNRERQTVKYILLIGYSFSLLTYPRPRTD